MSLAVVTFMTMIINADLQQVLLQDDLIIQLDVTSTTRTERHRAGISISEKGLPYSHASLAY